MIAAKYLKYVCLNLLCTLTLTASQNYYHRYSYYRSPSVQVSFKQNEYTAKESDGRVAITIEATRNYFYEPFHVKIRASVNRYWRHHLASSYDFEESVQTVRFSSGQSTATCYIKIKDDNRVENTEVFQVEILILHGVYPQRIQLGYPSKAKVFIKDDDRVIVTKPPTTRPPSHRVYVSFSHKEYRVKESDGHVVIKAVVRGHRRFPLRVVAISFVPTRFSLPAASGRDFKVGEYNLDFPVKSNVATVKIPIYDDYIVEGTEAFAVNLYIPDYYRNRYVDHGDPFLTKVIIDDDDKHPATKPPAPTKNPVTSTVKPVKSVRVQFSQQQNVMVDESADYLPLRVTVSGRRTSAISVNVTVFVSSKFQPKAATSDDVKTGVSRLIFYPYESSALISVKILDDKLVEGIESFGVQLIVPDHHKANGVKLGSPSLITVFIRDNDKPATSSSIASSPGPVIPSRTSSSIKLSPPTTSLPTSISPPPDEAPLPRSSSILIPPQTSSFVPISLSTSSSIQISFHTSSSVLIPPITSKSSFVQIQPSTTPTIPIFPTSTSSSVSIPLSTVTLSSIQILPSSSSILILPPASSFTIPSLASSSISILLPTSSSIKILSSPSSTTSSVSSSISFDKVFPTVVRRPIIEVTFKEMSYSADESTNSITFTIQASESSSVSFSVQFHTQNSNPLSAEDGVDYIAVNRTVTFPPNELRVSVTVDIINDRIHEDNETFIAVLKASNPFNDVVIGEQSTSVGIIFDDDILAIRFSNDSYSRVESKGPISITIISSVASDSPFTIQVCTREIIPQSAEADGDYISLVQNITFDNGSNNSNFSVELVDNKIAESDESFEVFIKLIPDSPYDVKLGDPSVVRVYIFDDDVPIPSVNLSSNRTSAKESDGFVLLTLLTSFPPKEPFTVQAFTRPRNRTTATSGEDFEPFLMNVTILPGETMRTINVTIIPDLIIEENERFYVQIEGFEGEPNTISLPDGAWVTIIDDDGIDGDTIENSGDVIETSGDDDTE